MEDICRGPVTSTFAAKRQRIRTGLLSGSRFILNPGVASSNFTVVRVLFFFFHPSRLTFVGHYLETAHHRTIPPPPAPLLCQESCHSSSFQTPTSRGGCPGSGRGQLQSGTQVSFSLRSSVSLAGITPPLLHSHGCIVCMLGSGSISGRIFLEPQTQPAHQ